uniref:Uncharacterized protein n=1 Tax=Knipowitschia caucasica TaxID=637954 RepID=A0AAV2KIB4_KNICA
MNEQEQTRKEGGGGVESGDLQSGTSTGTVRSRELSRGYEARSGPARAGQRDHNDQRRRHAHQPALKSPYSIRLMVP